MLCKTFQELCIGALLALSYTEVYHASTSFYTILPHYTLVCTFLHHGSAILHLYSTLVDGPPLPWLSYTVP